MSVITECCGRCRRGDGDDVECGETTCKCHGNQLGIISFAADSQGYSVAVTVNRQHKSFRFQVEYFKPDGSVAIGMTSWYPDLKQALDGLEEYAAQLTKEGWVRA